MEENGGKKGKFEKKRLKVWWFQIKAIPLQSHLRNASQIYQDARGCTRSSVGRAPDS